MEKPGVTPHSYLPQLLPHGERAMTVCEVEIVEHPVPGQLSAAVWKLE